MQTERFLQDHNMTKTEQKLKLPLLLQWTHSSSFCSSSSSSSSYHIVDKNITSLTLTANSSSASSSLFLGATAQPFQRHQTNRWPSHFLLYQKPTLRCLTLCVLWVRCLVSTSCVLWQWKMTLCSLLLLFELLLPVCSCRDSRRTARYFGSSKPLAAVVTWRVCTFWFVSHFFSQTVVPAT